MTTTTIGGLTAVTSLTGSDMLIVEKAVGNLTRKILFSEAADDFRTLMGLVMAIVDNAPFTDGTTELQPIAGVFDETAGTALTENDAAAPRIDSKRAWINTIEDATTRGQRLAVTANGEAKVLSGATIVTSAATQFTRPSDTTAYASGDIVANSTTAGSVAALTFASVTRTSAGACQIMRARIRKSTTTTTNASFRLHLFREAPTVGTAGDNATFANVANTNDSYIGALDITVDRAFSSGSAGYGAPTAGNALYAKLASGSTIYGLLEALAAYSPGNAETFDVALEVFQL